MLEKAEQTGSTTQLAVRLSNVCGVHEEATLLMLTYFILKKEPIAPGRHVGG